jgi:hypothetical protein
LTAEAVGRICDGFRKNDSGRKPFGKRNRASGSGWTWQFEAGRKGEIK